MDSGHYDEVWESAPLVMNHCPLNDLRLYPIGSMGLWAIPMYIYIYNEIVI